ncbi:MAG: porin [Hyphomicrobiales bacterium]
MKKSSLKALLAGTVAAGVMSTSAFAADLDVEPAKEYVEVGSFKGSILLPGTGVSFKVGGYAKGDVIFRFNDFGSGFGDLNETALTGGAAFGGVGGDQTRFHAAQTRINFDARTTTDLGSARAFIEGDFFSFDDGAGVNESVSNSERFRLRHAFAELGVESLGGTLLIGQTWTNFGDLGSYANTLDFNGPNAQVFIRQAQVRWTQPISDSVTLSIAAENPEISTGLSAAITNPGGTGLGGLLAEDSDSDGLDTFPDFTARLAAKTAFGNFSVAGLVRFLELDTNAARAANANGANVPVTDDSTIGFGIQVAGTINVGEKDKFRFQANYGQGIGRYLQFGPNAIQIDADGDLSTDDAFGITASYQHFWSDQLQSNLVGGYTFVDNNTTSTLAPVENEEIYAAINLIYSPRSNINLGIEGNYQRFESDNGVTDTSVDGFSLQTSLQFSF